MPSPWVCSPSRTIRAGADGVADGAEIVELGGPTDRGSGAVRNARRSTRIRAKPGARASRSPPPLRSVRGRYRRLRSIIWDVDGGCLPLVPPAWYAPATGARSLRPEARSLKPTMNRLLLIFAHPDDEAVFAAGTACRVVAGGGRVGLCTATLGDRGRDGEPAGLRAPRPGAGPPAGAGRVGADHGRVDVAGPGVRRSRLVARPLGHDQAAARRGDSPLPAAGGRDVRSERIEPASRSRRDQPLRR